MKPVEDSHSTYQYQISKFKRNNPFEDLPKSPMTHKYDSLLFSHSNPSKRSFKDTITTPTSISNNNNNISVRSANTFNIDQIESVMSRSDWFGCLKQAYQQLLTSQHEQEDGVDKMIFLQMIELNQQALPMITLRQYLSSQNSKRKEKWLSFNQVLESIRNIQTEEGVMHWDDIIDSLLISVNNPRQMDSVNVSNIDKESSQTLEYAMSPKDQKDFSKIKQLINLIRLKDQSILLDYSKVKGSYSPSEVSELLDLSLNREDLPYIRALSLSNTQFTLGYQRPLATLSKLDSLVILNLSALNSPQLLDDLVNVNLRNLQFLNISNNNLQTLHISNHNFPKLKEIYASKNRLNSAKPFVKVDTLKLLDLSDNLISTYEELICLAFSQGLVVLNLLGNPFQDDDFELNIKQILPRIMLLNPENISKVSCFENFKDIAFSQGDNQHQVSQDNDEDSMTQDSEDIPQRQVDLKAAIESYPFTGQSTPLQAQTSIKKVYLKKDISQSNIVTTASPQNANTSELFLQEALRTPTVKKQVSQVSKQEILNSTSQKSMFETQDCRIEDQPQVIECKNDHVKYFNLHSKKLLNETQENTEDASQRGDVKMPTQFNKYSQNLVQKQKPPICFKIKTTQERHEQSVKVLLDTSEQEGFIRNERRNFSQNVSVLNDNRSSLLGYAPGLHEVPKLDRANSDTQSIQIISKIEQPIRATSDNVEMAKYYEKVITGMNINRIKEMPSKEVCKVTSTAKGHNMSPINAMMITKPPETTTSRKASLTFSQDRTDRTYTPKQRTTNRTESRQTSYTKRSISNSNLASKRKLFSGDGNERSTYHNKTQNFNIGQIMNQSSCRHSKLQSGRNSRNKVLQTLQQQPTEMMTVETQLQRDQSPVLDSNRQSIRPFRLPPNESPSLYRKQDKTKENGKVHQPIKTTISSNEHRFFNMNTDCSNTRKHTIISTLDKDQPDLNTPRFSERKREAHKEMSYSDAIKAIKSKRKKQESKKQLYNSLNGKSTRQPSISSNSRQRTDTDTRNILSISAYKPENKISNQGTRIKLNIDLRKNK